MSLFVPDDGAPDPRTHALIIGVGGYRHLHGGEDERDKLIDQVGLLRQLTSPPRSASAVASWLRDHGTRLRTPLGSVEVLLSDRRVCIRLDEARVPRVPSAPAQTTSVRTRTIKRNGFMVPPPAD